MTELTMFLRHAKRNNNKQLDLSNRDLSFIPKQVFTIRSLEVLDLSNNKLVTLESAVTDLYRLQQLNLENNCIEALPEELQGLPNLKTLSLKGNPLNSSFSPLIENSSMDLSISLNKCFKRKTQDTPSWLKQSQNKQQQEYEKQWENPIGKSQGVSPMFNKTQSNQRKKFISRKTVQVQNESINGVLELKLKDLKIGEQISMGGFSTIHIGNYFQFQVAVKKVFNPNINEDLMKQFNNEIQILAKYRHPNIVLMIGAITIPPTLCLVMQLIKEGTLYELLHKRKATLADQQKRKIVRQLLNAYLFLHRHGIVHRDIKSQNVLLDRQFNVKICDFGLAKHKSQLNTGPMQFSGTPTYMAPELFLKKAFSESVDVFALGTVFYEIYYGEIPFLGLEPVDIKQKILKNSSFPNKIAVKKQITDIINKCRNINPEQRPSMHDLFNFCDW